MTTNEPKTTNESKSAEMVHCINKDCNQFRFTNCYTVATDGKLFTLKPCGSCPTSSPSVISFSNQERTPLGSPILDDAINRYESILESQLNHTSMSSTLVTNLSDRESPEPLTQDQKDSDDIAEQEVSRIDSSFDNIFFIDDTKNEEINSQSKVVVMEDTNHLESRESLKDIEIKCGRDLLHDSIIETEIGAYNIIRSEFKLKDIIVFQKQREQQEIEVLTQDNAIFKNKFICERIISGLLSGKSESAKRKFDIGLLLAPSRIQIHKVLLAVEINAKGDAKPVFYDYKKQAVYYGSYSDITSLDTKKMTQDFTSDEVDYLSQILIGWMLPHIEPRKAMRSKNFRSRYVMRKMLN